MAKCKVCRAPFDRRSMTHKCCSPECAIEYARKERENRERKEIAARKLAIKRRSEWLKDAEAAFNAYIRARDKDRPCISCGRFHTGSYDAGHYRSVGAAQHLRFNEDNVHKQCCQCNQHKSGNAIEYRIGLVARIGIERVERLETNNEIKKWSIEEAKAIKAEYKAKLKEIIDTQ